MSLAISSKQKISEDTRRKYYARGRQLVARFERETGKPWDESPEKIIDWLNDLKKVLMKNSFAQYKSALYYFMLRNNKRETASAIKKMTQAGCAKKTGRTSSGKRKLAPREDIIKIVAELKKSKSLYAKILAQWLWLNETLGLRPCEWETAYEKGDTLYVKNAKATNMRGNGQTRTLDIGKMTPEHRKLLSTFLAEMHAASAEGRFSKTYESCSKLLRRVNAKLFPKSKRIVLYSTRHQAIANQKAMNNDYAMTAAFAGHSVVDTATEHYGKRRVGRVSPDLPIATAECKLSVRRQHHKKRPISE